MSAIIATETEAERFLELLLRTSERQKNISAQLDHLMLLLQMPSEDVLRVLRALLRPMDLTMKEVTLTLAAALPTPPMAGSTGEGS